MKICKDCKYYKKSIFGRGMATCGHPNATRHPVDGKDRGRGRYLLCESLRISNKYCGTEGIWWKKKRS